MFFFHSSLFITQIRDLFLKEFFTLLSTGLSLTETNGGDRKCDEMILKVRLFGHKFHNSSSYGSCGGHTDFGIQDQDLRSALTSSGQGTVSPRASVPTTVN